MKPLSADEGWVDDELLSNTVFGVDPAAHGPRAPPHRSGEQRCGAGLVGPGVRRRVVPRLLLTRVGCASGRWSTPCRASSLVDVLRSIEAWVDGSGERIPFPVEVRVAAADDIWLSTAYERETAYIAVHQFHRLDHERYFRAVESIVGGVGRPPALGQAALPRRRASWSGSTRASPTGGRSAPGSTRRGCSRTPTSTGWSDPSGCPVARARRLVSRSRCLGRSMGLQDAARGPDPPGIGEQLGQLLDVDLGPAHQHRRVAVVVRGGEELRASDWSSDCFSPSSATQSTSDSPSSRSRANSRSATRNPGVPYDGRSWPRGEPARCGVPRLRSPSASRPILPPYGERPGRQVECWTRAPVRVGLGLGGLGGQPDGAAGPQTELGDCGRRDVDERLRRALDLHAGPGRRAAPGRDRARPDVARAHRSGRVVCTAMLDGRSPTSTRDAASVERRVHRYDEGAAAVDLDASSGPSRPR